MKIGIFLSFLTLSFWVSAAEVPQSYLNDIDSKIYRVETDGVKDLYFEVQVDGIAEQLNQSKSYGKIDNVYFKVCWLFPGKFHIEVEGLPLGFKELRQSLISAIAPQLNHVFPPLLKKQLRSFQLSLKRRKAKGDLIIGKDVSYQSAINEVQIVVNRYLVTKMIYKKPVGTETVNFKYKSVKGKAGKYELQSMSSVSYVGVNVIKTDKKVKYKRFEGWSFPISIKTTTTQELNIGNSENQQKKPSRTLKSETRFTAFEVNKGKAHKKIMIGNKIN